MITDENVIANIWHFYTIICVICLPIGRVSSSFKWNQCSQKRILELLKLNSTCVFYSKTKINRSEHRYHLPIYFLLTQKHMTKCGHHIEMVFQPLCISMSPLWVRFWILNNVSVYLLDFIFVYFFVSVEIVGIEKRSGLYRWKQHDLCGRYIFCPNLEGSSSSTSWKYDARIPFNWSWLVKKYVATGFVSVSIQNVEIVFAQVFPPKF